MVDFVATQKDQRWAALLVMEMVIVKHVVLVTIVIRTSATSVAVGRQVQQDPQVRLLVWMKRKVTVPNVQVVVNAFQVLAKTFGKVIVIVVVPRENRWVAMPAIPVVTALLVMLITTSPTRSATSATVGRQVLQDPQDRLLACPV